jgi:hypothetical protein
LTSFSAGSAQDDNYFDLIEADGFDRGNLDISYILKIKNCPKIASGS